MKIKKTIVAVISFALAAVLSFSGCGFGGEAEKDSSDITDSVGSDVGIENPDSSDQEKAPENVVENGGSYMMPKVMSFTSTSLASASETGIMVELTAVVTPEDAPDKSVDWTAAWAPEAALSGEPLEDYLTLVPESDGSQTVQVTCKKAFADNVIIITVTTRDGGFQDFCNVKFIGIPTELKVICDNWEQKTESGFTYIALRTNEEYEVLPQLTNVFDSVSDQYNDFEVTLTGYGKISVQTYYTDLEGNNGGFTGAAASVDIDDRKDYFLTYDFSSGIIDLNPIGSFGSYQQYLSQTSTRINYLKFKGYYTVWSDCYFKLSVVENESGLSWESLPIRVESSVTNVNISEGILTF